MNELKSKKIRYESLRGFNSRKKHNINLLFHPISYCYKCNKQIQEEHKEEIFQNDSYAKIEFIRLIPCNCSETKQEITQ